jgi:hypothetical protein
VRPLAGELEKEVAVHREAAGGTDHRFGQPALHALRIELRIP